MNISYTSKFPSECAAQLHDTQVEEQLQLVARILDGYAAEGSNPWLIWAYSSQFNYVWLVNYFGELSNEYSQRFHIEHDSAGRVFDFVRIIDSYDFPSCEPTSAPQND